MIYILAKTTMWNGLKLGGNIRQGLFSVREHETPMESMKKNVTAIAFK